MTFASVVALLNALWTAFKNIAGLFGGGEKVKPDENTQAVEVANKAGALSASEARDIRAETEKELSTNATQTDADVAAVRDARSLQDGSDAVNRAIARSRAHPYSDG